MKRRFSLRISTPGKRPASHRIWKPLQTPSTRPPWSANLRTASMMGAARRDRAAAQIIAIGEAARQHHQVGAGGQLVLGMPDHGGRAAGDQLQGARHVALAIDAGEDEDGGVHPSTSTL